MTRAVAALDCGSNSTRLLLVGEDHGSLRREMRITRLSEGVDATGHLTDAALERSYRVLREYRGYMDEYSLAGGLLVATSAVRDASNGADFLAEAARITGVDARILTGSEEATFSYAGATHSLAPDDRTTLIVDIGGGSTEMAMELGGVLYSYSMQLGCVRVTERALGKGVVTPDRAAAAREMIELELDKALTSVPAFAEVVGRVRIVGLAGTVSTLAQLDAGLRVYDRDAVHHRRLSRVTVAHWRDHLGGETPDVRLAEPGMVAGREDVLVAGLYVLDAVLGRFGADELMSSEDDILDGIASSLLD